MQLGITGQIVKIVHGTKKDYVTVNDTESLAYHVVSMPKNSPVELGAEGILIFDGFNAYQGDYGVYFVARSCHVSNPPKGGEK